MNTPEEDATVAIQAEALYLINLMLAPGLAFIALLWLARRHAGSPNQMTRCHLRQTVRASLWAGVLLSVVTLMIVLLGGLRIPATWVLLIIYFICWHSALILFGVRGLACAMAGKYYVYPLIGVRTWRA